MSTYIFVGDTVLEIQTKTGSIASADTDSWITLEICQQSKDKCCSVRLNEEDIDDMERGATNYYNTEKELGNCFNWKFSGNVEVTLSTYGTDGWFVEWVDIRTTTQVEDRISSFICPFDTWIDYDYEDYWNDYENSQHKSTSTCARLGKLFVKKTQ